MTPNYTHTLSHMHARTHAYTHTRAHSWGRRSEHILVHIHSTHLCTPVQMENYIICVWARPVHHACLQFSCGGEGIFKLIVIVTGCKCFRVSTLHRHDLLWVCRGELKLNLSTLPTYTPSSCVPTPPTHTMWAISGIVEPFVCLSVCHRSYGGCYLHLQSRPPKCSLPKQGPLSHQQQS